MTFANSSRIFWRNIFYIMNPRFSYRFHIFFNRNKKIVSLKQPPPSLVRQTEISSRSSISSDITIITRVCLPLFAAKKQKRCKIYLIKFEGVHVTSLHKSWGGRLLPAHFKCTVTQFSGIWLYKYPGNPVVSLYSKLKLKFILYIERWRVGGFHKIRSQTPLSYYK